MTRLIAARLGADVLTGYALGSHNCFTTIAAMRPQSSLAEKKGIAAGKVFQPLRVALTGLTVSPGIFEVLVMMGRDLALKRIGDAVAWLENAGNNQMVDL